MGYDGSPLLRKSLLNKTAAEKSAAVFLNLLRKLIVGQAFSLTFSGILMNGGLKTRPTNTYVRVYLTFHYF
jgi:hypothetical protein